MFTAQTDTTWEEFLNSVYNHLSGPRSDVQLGFWLGETGTMLCLASEQDWAITINQLCARVRSAQTCAVSMEIKNVVSHLHTMKEWSAYLQTLAAQISTQEGPWIHA